MKNSEVVRVAHRATIRSCNNWDCWLACDVPTPVGGVEKNTVSLKSANPTASTRLVFAEMYRVLLKYVITAP
ncbi:MAG: hypothetical protein K2W85_14080 [Phycisphaerales bacterium]|nr:hypothetical protein [Phycisphaerales bacterium]